jgi:hypothetical protein
VSAELQYCLDDSIGDTFDQAPISGRGRHDILPVCLGNEIRLDEELQSVSTSFWTVYCANLLTLKPICLIGKNAKTFCGSMIGTD